MSRFVNMITWDDAPHLTKEQKDELLKSIPPYQRDARSKGVPQLGSGAIYPVPESEYTVDDFPIPKHWLHAYGLDVGWNCTACVWAAMDPQTRQWYIYSVYKSSQEQPSVHAQGIKSRGSWVPGVIDPAARGRSQKDGEQLIQIYRDLGLNLIVANNSVESGLYEVWNDLSSGRLKVFKSCHPWFAEVRLYRRDDKGKVVKTNDHLMDATRYLKMSGLDLATAKGRDVRRDVLEALGLTSVEDVIKNLFTPAKQAA